MASDRRKHIAIVGSGAAGLAAAWLLSGRHKISLLEKEDRLGGHAHTATVPVSSHLGDHLKIDTGFIVYNEPSYPNLTRWFAAMGVATEASDMSFAVSRDSGAFEYAGGPLLGLLAQPSLLMKPRFWRMLLDLLRFYRQAPQNIPHDSTVTLGDYLTQHRYSQDFIDDHLLPFGAAIWSSPRQSMLDYPAASFIRFCTNHGLLQIRNRPQWRTVTGGSEAYVGAVAERLDSGAVTLGFKVSRIERQAHYVLVHSEEGRSIQADEVIIATHADQALNILDKPTEDEKRLLSTFAYETNLAYLHTDTRYLPRRRRAWCSWNYVEMAADTGAQVSLSYWMNRLQNLPGKTQYVVTLNPGEPPPSQSILRTQYYEHPLFNANTWMAQQHLWSLQGRYRTWFCGSYFGSGFHEDAVQSGFAVAEQLGGVARPWTLADPSTRIVVPAGLPAAAPQVAV